MANPNADSEDGRQYYIYAYIYPTHTKRIVYLFPDRSVFGIYVLCHHCHWCICGYVAWHTSTILDLGIRAECFPSAHPHRLLLKIESDGMHYIFMRIFFACRNVKNVATYHIKLPYHNIRTSGNGDMARQLTLIRYTYILYIMMILTYADGMRIKHLMQRICGNSRSA